MKGRANASCAGGDSTILGLTCIMSICPEKRIPALRSWLHLGMIWSWYPSFARNAFLPLISLRQLHASSIKMGSFRIYSGKVDSCNQECSNDDWFCIPMVARYLDLRAAKWTRCQDGIQSESGVHRLISPSNVECPTNAKLQIYARCKRIRQAPIFVSFSHLLHLSWAVLTYSFEWKDSQWEKGLREWSDLWR